MKKTILFVVLILETIFVVYPQTTLSVLLQNNSSITINGTSNLVSFKLSQRGDKLANKTFLITASQIQNKIILSQNQYAIAVKNFDSNNKMALRDFLKLVKSTIYPDIKITLNYIENHSNDVLSDYSKGQASVNITITNVTRQYLIPVSSNKSSDLYNLTGKMKLNIKDFGLVPPNVMFGLIKVNELIDIDFHLICKIIPYNDSKETKKSAKSLADSTKF
jgi:hypothetical protein